MSSLSGEHEQGPEFTVLGVFAGTLLLLNQFDLCHDLFPVVFSVWVGETAASKVEGFGEYLHTRPDIDAFIETALYPLQGVAVQHPTARCIQTAPKHLINPVNRCVKKQIDLSAVGHAVWMARWNKHTCRSDPLSVTKAFHIVVVHVDGNLMCPVGVIAGCAWYAYKNGQAHGAGELLVQYQDFIGHDITNDSTIFNSVTTVNPLVLECVHYY